MQRVGKGNGQLESSFQPRQELAAGNLRRSHANQMRTGLLDVKHDEPARLQMTDHVDQGHFRGVPDAMEHRFSGKKATQRQSVQAAHQLAALPDFDAVRHAQPVQLDVGFGQMRCDPCAVPRSAGACTGPDDARKIRVERDLELTAVQPAPQAARDIQTVKLQDGPRIGTEPKESFRGLCATARISFWPSHTGHGKIPWR